MRTDRAFADKAIERLDIELAQRSPGARGTGRRAATGSSPSIRRDAPPAGRSRGTAIAP
jgi:hypothetical protein